jgi:c-di-GMP-binding flagellar brake protein YcgR
VILHNEEQIFIAPLENISAGGLFINHVIQLQVGTEVRLVVKSPKMGVSVQAVGQVVRVENEARKGSAIVFTTISEVAQQMINACVFEAKLEHSAASGTRRDA